MAKRTNHGVSRAPWVSADLWLLWHEAAGDRPPRTIRWHWHPKSSTVASIASYIQIGLGEEFLRKKKTTSEEFRGPVATSTLNRDSNVKQIENQHWLMLLDRSWVLESMLTMLRVSRLQKGNELLCFLDGFLMGTPSATSRTVAMCGMKQRNVASALHQWNMLVQDRLMPHMLE